MIRFLIRQTEREATHSMREREKEANTYLSIYLDDLVSIIEKEEEDEENK